MINKQKESIRHFIEGELRKILKHENQIKKINFDDNFFQIGVDSLQLATLELKIIEHYSSLGITPGLCYSNFTPEKVINKIWQIQNNQKFEKIIPNLSNEKTAKNSINNLGIIFKNFNVSSSKDTKFILKQPFNAAMKNFNSSKFLTQKLLNNIPLSHSQQRCWFSCYNNEHENFFEQFSLQLPSTLYWEQSRLIGALNYVILSNFILRTGIAVGGCFKILYSGTESFFALPIQQKSLKYHDERVNINFQSEIPLRFSISSKNVVWLFHAKFHNILVDGKSIRFFMEQLLLTLSGFAKILKCNQLTNQYYEYSVAEKQFLTSNKFKDQRFREIKFWKNKLKGWKNNCKLFQRNYKNKLDGCTQIVNILIGNTNNALLIYEGIKALAEKSGATVFCTLVSVFRILLYKMFGADDVFFGVPVDNRIRFHNSAQNFSKSIGVFLNMCVAREKINPHISVSEFVQQNSRGLVDTLKHSQIPFDILISELRKNFEFNDIRAQNLFEIAVIQDTSILDDIKDLKHENLKLDDIKIINNCKKYIAKGSPQYPIMWHFIEEKNNKKIRISIAYDNRLKLDLTVKSMVNKYILLCEKIVGNISTKNIESLTINSLNLLSCKDTKKLLTKNKTQLTEYPVSHPIISIFFQLAKLPPKKTVLKQGACKELSAKELLNLAQALQIILSPKISDSKAYGFDAPLIAILHKKNFNLISIILGLWATGATILPISNEWSKKKIIDSLQEISSELILITDRDSLDIEWPNQICANALIDEAKKLIQNQKVFKVECGSRSAHDLLYLTFTSGSTGKPKIIAAEAHKLMNFVKRYTEIFQYDSDSVVYQLVNYSFDIFFGDILISLINGSLLLLAEKAIPSMTELSKCTHAYVMPAYLSQVRNINYLSVFSHLKVLQFGGESISKTWLLDAVKAGITLVQLFGLTETTIYSTYQWFLNKEMVIKNHENIGTPFPNAYIFVVDNDKQIIPESAIGAEGNLCIGGVDVSTGYFCNGDNSKFGFQPLLNLRYFETNDRVLIKDDKNLRFLGRSDEIVKVKGNLVEPHQIEKIIIDLMADIKNCVVIVKDNNLTAYIQLNNKKESKYDIDEIKKQKILLVQRLEEEYPRHIIPHKIIIVKEFQLNSNGKIDRQALAKNGKAYTESNFLEKEKEWIKDKISNNNMDNICKIFAVYLCVESVSPTTNLFECGADSLKLLMAVQEVEIKHGLCISIDDLFQYKSIERVFQSNNVKESIVQNKNKPYTTKPNYKMVPVSYNQEHLWFLDKLNRDLNYENDAYLITLKLKFNKCPQKCLSTFAINLLIQENTVLRTLIKTCTFFNGDDEVLQQQILSGTECFVNLFGKQINQTTKCSINITFEIPIKVISVTDKSNFRLTLTFHHIAVDGKSLEIIRNSIVDYYQNYEKYKKVSKKIQLLPYVKFAERQRSENFSTSLNYWKAELEHIKNNIMPSDYSKMEFDTLSNSTNNTIDQITHNIQIPITKVQEFLNEYSCSLTQTLLAAYVLLLESEISDDEVVIGMPFSNRLPENNYVIGYFAIMHGIRFLLNKNSNITNLMTHIREKVLKATEHAHVPFELIVKHLLPKRRLNSNPIFQRVFSHEQNLNQGTNVIENNVINLGNDQKIIFKENNSKASKFDQYWIINSQKNTKYNSFSFQFIVEFNPKLFKKFTIENSIEKFKLIFTALLNGQVLSLNSMDGCCKNKVTNVQSSFSSLEDVKDQVNLIWCQILQLNQVKNNENFFELGGHSLLANRICSMIRSNLQINCKLSDLFKYQSINDISQHLWTQKINKIEKTPQSVDSESLKTNSIKKIESGPCCYLQTQLLRIYKDANSAQNASSINKRVFSYTIPIEIKLKKSVSVSRLQTCLKELITTQPSLRTIFECNNNEKFFQKVLPINEKLMNGYFINSEWNENYYSRQKATNDESFELFNPFNDPPVKFRLFKNKVLRFEFSHLIFDGTSINILIAQLIKLYYKNNDEYISKDVTPDNFYIEFTNKFNAKCNKNIKKTTEYWLSIFEKYNHGNKIVTDKFKFVSETFNSTSKEVTYHFKNLNLKIGKLCGEYGILPLTVLMFALGKVLQQKMSFYFSNFFIGTVKDMRDSETLNNKIGFFVNTLPIPIAVNEPKLTTVALQHLDKLINDILNFHSYISYDKLLDIAKSESLFQIMIVIDSSNGDINHKKTPNLEFEVADCKLNTTKFEITIFITYNFSGVNIRVEFYESLFDESCLNVMIENWVDIITRFADSKNINAEPIFIDAYNKIADRNNDNQQIDDFPSNYDIFEIFIQQSKLIPSTLAIQVPDSFKNLTYEKLPHVLDSLSAMICWCYFKITGELLVGDTLIAILGRRNCIKSVLLSLAVIRSGGAYLSIDADINPDERIQNILFESNVKFCISVKSSKKLLKNVFVDKINEYAKIIQGKLFKLPKPLKKKRCNSQTDLAYVIFTSGTTGKPKGVTIERRSITNMIVDATKLSCVDAGDCVYQFTDFCFDNSVLEIFLAFFNGATLFIDDVYPNDLKEDSSLRQTKFFCVERFCKHVDEFKITHALFFPALVETFEDDELHTLAKCKYWISGAEKLSQNLMKRALAFGVHIVQVYGPTECTCYMLSKRMRFDDHPQNLGLPFRNTKVSVRTPVGDPAMPYTLHQLYVAGIGLTRGYLNCRPENQPFSNFDGLKYYCTGDIVQQFPNGEILFIGRKDNQLKIRGFRVELGDIEAVLIALPNIKAAKVIADVEQNKDLIAYLVADTSAKKLNEIELRQFCRQKLPYYMVPRDFLFLKSLPLTTNSKIDIKNLPRPNYLQLDNMKENTEKSIKQNLQKSGDDFIKKKENDLLLLCKDNSFNETINNKKVSTEIKHIGKSNEKNYCNFQFNLTKKVDSKNSANSSNLSQVKTSKKIDLLNLNTSKLQYQFVTEAKPSVESKCQNKTEVQNKLIDTFSSILNITHIENYLDETFIYLGGNSLNGQRIINQIRSTFNLDYQSIEMSVLLNVNTTLSKVIDNISKIVLKNIQANIQNSAGYSKITEKQCEQFLKIPLSYQQEQMYYLSQIDTQKLYILPLIQKLSFDVDVSALHYAFMKIIQDQSILRTVIQETNDYDIFQQILSMTECYHYCNDTDNIPIFTKSEIHKFCNQTFDLLTEPPIKYQLFLGDNTYVLIVLMHHIASDASSTEILESFITKNYNDLKKLKNDAITKKNSDIKAKLFFKSNSYALWSIEQKGYKLQKEIEAKSDFVAKKLFPLFEQQLNIETLFCKNTCNNEFNAKSNIYLTKFSIPLNTLKESKFTAFTFVCTSFVIAIIKFIKMESLVSDSQLFTKYVFIGSPVSNRLNTDVEEVIGNFLNNLILALPLQIFSDANLIKQKIFNIVQQQIEKAYKYVDVPFSKIINAFRKISLNTNGIYNVYINCRYKLENESKLSKMKDVIIDQQFTDETLKMIRDSNNSLNQFIEIDIDQMADYYDITVKFSATTKTTKSMLNINLIETFFRIFQTECLQLTQYCAANVIGKVYSAICDTLPYVSNFSENETFFSLGGNSLLLIKLRRKLETKLNIKIDIIDLLNNLQISNMVQLCQKLTVSKTNLLKKDTKIRHKSQNDFDKKFFYNHDFLIHQQNVVQQLYISDNITKNKTSLIIVFFHALIGGNLSYMALRESIKKFNTSKLLILGVQHPETFYKIQDFFPKNSLLELAEYYASHLKEILTTRYINFKGKLVFIGASMGATIAYEVCVALRNYIDVDLVISIDGNAILNENPISKNEHCIEMLKIIQRRKAVDINIEGESFNDWLDCSTRDHMIENAWQMLELRRNHKNSKNNNFEDAAPVKMILLKTKEENQNSLDDFGWRSLGVHLEHINLIAGNHNTMLDSSNCETLAQTILKYCS